MRRITLLYKTSLCPIVIRMSNIKLFVIAMLSITSFGCAVSNTVTWYSVDADSPHCVLRFDNRISDAVFGWTPSVYIEVFIDGSQPTERHYIPEGVTSVRLTPGKHTVVHRAVTKAGSVFGISYNSDPVVMSFDALAGKIYTIRFDYSGTYTQGAYDATYEGWSDKESASWGKRNEVYRHRY